jgi:glutathione peroxidase
MQGVQLNNLPAGLRGLVLCVLVLAQQVAAQSPATPQSGTCPPLLNKTFKRLQDEAPQSLCQFAGKVVLVVNTASYCGFTFQYEGLEKLQSDLGLKGLVVLGFPSNDFGQLEPGNNKQIADFCANTYGVKFPMFEKSVVTGANANVLYRELAQTTGKTPQWNFHKYLIDRKGQVVGSYASTVNPQDKRLQSDIERALAGN